MQKVNAEIEESWKQILDAEFQTSYFADLKAFLLEEKRSQIIYPPSRFIFEAFKRTPFENVKVVILGQDPYHGEGQAHGLSFSVPDGVNAPPSLRNIFKELQSDLGLKDFNRNDLSSWADQGVLLLNATLTVRARTAGSHQNKGWEQFTDAVIKNLSDQREDLVFVLWGSYAQNKGAVIDASKHYVIKSAHPSPFSAHRGFIGSKPFSKANDFLMSKGKTPIDWSLDH